MDVSLQHVRRHIVLAPQGDIVAHGPAEDFERILQDIVRQGYKHITVDLSNVPAMDSAGIRALVRAHTSAKRRQIVFRLADLTPHVRELLRAAQLDGVLPVFASVDEAGSHDLPWYSVGLTVASLALCAALVWLGLEWHEALTIGSTGGPTALPGAGAPPHAPANLIQPLVVVAKLLAAALVGFLVTAIHRPVPTEGQVLGSTAHGRAGRAMAEAQVLLCVSGAMVMVIIGDSLARAFGIAGAASIIRFRTPVDDPKDVTVLFLLMGLGMAIGLGAFAAAGLATLFLCALLVLLARAARHEGRAMLLEVVSDGRTFPMNHVLAVLARNNVTVEPREIKQKEKEATISYLALVPSDASLDDLNTQLVGDGARGVKSVSWEAPRKSAA